MNHVLKLSLSEIKKITIRPYIYLATLVAMAASIAMGIEVTRGSSFNIDHVFIFFSMVAEWIMIYYGSKVLGEEFSSKTSTIIFTKDISRKNIILSKILSMAGIGMILGVILSLIATFFQYNITGSISSEFLVRDVLSNIVSYILFALLVGSIGPLVSLLTMNATSSLLITLLMIQFLPALLEIISSKFTFMKDVLGFVPLYSAIPFIEQHQLSPKPLVSIVTGIIVFTISSIVVVKKKDLI